MKKLTLVALALSLGLLVVGCTKKAAVETDNSALTQLKYEFENNNIHFDFDRFNIRADQIPILNAKVSYLQQDTAANAEVQGHCDERGTLSYNRALADRRAKAAYNYLVDQGISGSRLNTVSYGEERPLDTGHNEAAWATNRRAQFVLR
ncbi:MAG: OmpA family protein [Deltaproteobacteria bacterium]|jgi:peptidoglycan-associated lipoprotein|nr:OmpA family protein [Deltaproteobacteria bacterium]